MRISEIAKLNGYEFCGKDVDIDSIRFAECASESSIAIIRKEDCLERIKARCILANISLFNTDKSIIYTSDPLELASIKIASVLYEEVAQHYVCSSYCKKEDFYIGNNVTIGENTIIGPNVCIDDDVIIGNNCYIAPNSHICYGTIIKDGTRIGDSCTIGADSFCHYYEDGLQEFPGLGSVIIGERVHIGNKTIIQRGTFSDTVIGDRCKIGNLIDIGHDVTIGNDCKIVSQSGIASDVRISNYVTIFGQAGVSNGVSIGEKAIVYAKSLVTKDINDYQCVSGMYARNHVEELKTQAKLRNL